MPLKDTRTYVITTNDEYELPIWVGELDDLELETEFRVLQIRGAKNDGKNYFGTKNKRFKFFILED